MNTTNPASTPTRWNRHPYRGDRSAPISLLDAIGYGLGDAYGGGSGGLVSTYLVLFWTRFCGMSISTAQSVLGLSAVISGVSSLVFGVLDDNLFRFGLGRRFGRRHFFILLTAPLLLVGMLMWVPGLPFVVYFLVYLLWVAAGQLFASAYNTLPGEMTSSFDDRTKLSTVRLLISGASSTVILWMGSLVLSVFGERRPLGYMVLAIGVTLCFVLEVLVCWRATWEMTPADAGFDRYAHDGVRASHIGLRDWGRRIAKMMGEYTSTLKIASFRRHLAIYLLILTAGDVFNQTFLFFVIYDWHKSAAFASLLLSASIISVPLTPLFGVAMTKFGPKRLYKLGFAGCLVGLTWIFAAWKLEGTLPGGWWTVFAVASVMFFFCAKGLSSYLPWAVFPFIADVDQLVSGRYRGSTFSGFQGFFRQCTAGLASVCVGAVLGAVGFNSSLHSQSQLACNGLAALMFGWYGISVIIAWIIVRRFTLDKRTDAIALAEVNRVQSGGAPADVDPAIRATVEDLTGQPYGR
ncbi:MFS transporter [Bifidobacterium sp. ESL0728]|uniref:MFS transporter n=1 Tax=Bifidobacterium sp. ESL0728 TaxID=2983220 RepID=UPI0023F954B3|nr:MFS transporter [Bifidobacterium sp. ESL0728]WEV59189.1 MFS transporter [Bifidobacterium sp. ESL0728]